MLKLFNRNDKSENIWSYLQVNIPDKWFSTIWTLVHFSIFVPVKVRSHMTLQRRMRLETGIT